MESEEFQLNMDRYEIRARLGDGASGVTYRVFDSVADEERAFKLLSFSSEFSADAFKQEFLHLADLQHEGLVRVHDFGFTKTGEPYFTMDFVDGEPINRALFEHDNSFDHAMFYKTVLRILEALEYIHRHNILHGDLKPENILIRKTGNGLQPVLVDFGLAVTANTDGSGISGTLDYLAPEVITGARRDARSDLYALGATLYHVLAGQPPFSEDNPADLLRAHLEHDAPPLSSLDSGLHTELNEFIHTLLEKEPGRRFYSAYEAGRKLAGIAGLPFEFDDAGESTPRFSASLIGRGKELHRLLELADQSETEARIILIHGPEGVGKSRLLSDLRSHLLVRGTRVRTATCRTGDAALAPVKKIVRQIVTEVGEEHAAFLQYASILHSLFPEFWKNIEEPPHLDAEGNKLRLFHALASIMCADDSKPSAIILDSLESADATTKEFWTYLASFLQAVPRINLIILGSSRTTFDGKCECLTLAPLNRGDTRTLITTLLGTEVSESFTQAIFKQTGGNPRFMIELLEYCVEKHIITRDHEGWHVHERENLTGLFPASLVEILRDQVQRLDTGARLVTAAIADSISPLGAAALSAACELDQTEVRNLADELHRAGLIVGSWHGYTPASEALVSIIREELPDDTLRAIHRRLAEYFEDASSDVSPRVLGHHWYSAGEHQRARPYLVEAAKTARSHQAFADAADLLQHVIEHEPVDANLEEKFDILSDITELWNVLGIRQKEEEAIQESLVTAAQLKDNRKLAHVYSNQAEYFLALGEFDRAQRSAEKALGLYEALGDFRGCADAQTRLGFIHFRRRNTTLIDAAYGKALEYYAQLDDTRGKAQVLLDLGVAYYFLEDPKRASETLEQAFALFSELGDRRGMARCLGNMGIQLFHNGLYEQAYERYRQVLDIFHDIGDRRGLARAENSMGQVLVAMSRYSEARRHLLEARNLALEIRDNYTLEGALENLAELYTLLGAYPEAVQIYRQTIEIAGSSGNAVGKAASLIDLAGIFIETREMEEAGRSLAEAEHLLKDHPDTSVQGWWYFRNGLLRLNSKALDEAFKAFSALGDHADKHGLSGLSVLARSYAALACHYQGDHTQALALSQDALHRLESLKTLTGGTQDIYYNHARILRGSKHHAEAKAFISAAHEALMEIAGNITDSNFYRSFLEDVRIHREIVREYAATHRTDSLHTVAAIRERNLQTLYEVSRQINSVRDLPELLDLTMDLALQTMNGERGLIFLIEDENLILKVSRNMENEMVEDATEISQSVISDVLSGGKPLVVTDAQNDEAFRNRKSVKNFRIHSILCVPLRLKDQIIGTVYIDSRSESFQSTSFSEIDIEFLEAFANLAAIAVENARLHDSLVKENLYLRKEVESRYAFENIIGQSAPMKKLYKEMEVAIENEGNVLIIGESGTGKELVAKAIHYNSRRKNHNFVAVDCGALPDTLLESELFGHKKGAFTGAVTDKPGLFEEADKGTLFLDEISNTSLAFQAKLLRVLQEGEFRRVGETSSRFVDVRIICATNTDPQAEIQAGRFRQDLFFRLNVIPIVIVPLRERKSDIPLLVEHFVEKHNRDLTRKITGVSKDFMDYCVQAPWPGNVRELENFIHRVMVSTQSDVLTTKDIPAGEASSRQAVPYGETKAIDFKPPRRISSLDEAMRDHIQYVLKHVEGNKTEAAKILGLKRTTLIERMKKLGMM